MTNQLSKTTRGRLYTRALAHGGRPAFDALINNRVETFVGQEIISTNVF